MSKQFTSNHFLFFQGADLMLLFKHMNGDIDAIVKDAADVGMNYRVKQFEPIQSPTGNTWTMIILLEHDPVASMLPDNLKTLLNINEKLSESIDQGQCDHDFTEGPKCKYCGLHL